MRTFTNVYPFLEITIENSISFSCNKQGLDFSVTKLCGCFFFANTPSESILWGILYPGASSPGL